MVPQLLEPGGPAQVQAGPLLAREWKIEDVPAENAGWHELCSLLERADGSLFLAEEYLVVRNKAGTLQPLKANKAQRLFEERRGRENIVLKARQVGMSTWIAGRFLLKTILVPGTTTLMVAHTRESADALFAVVTRMWENLPTLLRCRASLSRANARLMTFPAVDSEFRIASAGEPNAGRGLSVQNLHCSEVARWGGDAAETLAGLRAALVPDGELVLESTPNGAYGCFHAEWQAADESGMVRHFAPWWFEPSYVGTPATNYTAGGGAAGRRARGSRRTRLAFAASLPRRFGALRAQEFAEDPVTCFRVERVVLLRSGCGRGSAWASYVPPSAVTHGPDPADLVAAGDGRHLPCCGRRCRWRQQRATFAAVQVIDEATGMQCAELQARLSPRDLAQAAADFAREYNGALLVIERNNHGSAVLAFLESATGLKLYTGPRSHAGMADRCRIAAADVAGACEGAVPAARVDCQ